MLLQKSLSPSLPCIPHAQFLTGSDHKSLPKATPEPCIEVQNWECADVCQIAVKSSEQIHACILRDCCNTDWYAACQSQHGLPVWPLQMPGPAGGCIGGISTYAHRKTLMTSHNLKRYAVLETSFPA